MIIAYDQMSDVLSVTLQAAPVAQTQQQGTVAVNFDTSGQVVSVSIPAASTLLWENGGQVNIMLPEKVVAAQTPVVVETVVERRVL